MALTATFAADFDRFESALKGAAFNLQVFDRATAKAMQSLKKETETFSGQKVAVEAARMAEAVTRLGGAGGSAAGLLKLLPDELKRVATALDTAAAKAKLLGETLPPSLQKVHAEVTALSKATATLPPATSAASNGFASLATAFKGFLALGITAQIASIARSVVNAVDEFDELAGRISDTTDNIQKLQAISQSYDVTLDALVNGVQELQKRLGDPSKEFIESLGKLNLTVAELKALAPTDAIVEMLAALGRIPNAADRAAIANETLGRSQKELAGAMKEGVEQTDAWIKMSPETIKFVDSLKEGTSRLTSAMLALTAELAANISGWNAWQTAVTDGRLALNALVLDAKNMKRVLSEQMGDLPDIKGALPKPTAIGPAIDPTDAKAMAAIEKSLTKSAEAAIDFNREMQQAAKATQKAKDEATVWGGGIAEADHWMEELAKHARELEAKMVKFADLFEMGPDIHMGTFQKWLDSRTEAVRAWSQTNQKKITEIFDFGPDPQIGIISEQMDKQAKSITGQLEKVFASLPDTLARAFEGGGGLAGAFKSIGVQIADAISEPIIKGLTKMQKTAVSAGATAATAFGGGVGGGMGATVAGIASGLGGAALAASAWGTSMTAAGVSGAIALGAATLGIGAAAVGVALLAKHFLTVSKDIKEARKQLEDFNKSMNETLTRQQQMEAGGQQWAATLIQVRDAMIALGVPLEQALSQSQALVKQLLNTDDPRRSRAAMEQIAALMQRLELAKESAGGIFDDIVDLAEQGIPDFLQPMIDQLIELGLLTDEQEQKLREMGDAGATNWKRIEEAAAKYGVRQESLGQPFNAQRIAADAAGIINAFTAIVNAGGDVGGVLFDMQDEISKVVQDAKQFGTTIPANMKPWIEELIRAGLLVDENGEKITDIGRVQFGDEIETEAEKTRKAFEGITKAIQDLINTLKGLPDRVNLPFVDRGGSGGGGGDGGPRTIEGAPGTSSPSSAPGGRVSAMIDATGGASSKQTFNIPISVDGRVMADVVIDQMGNRLSVRGAR